MKVFLTYKLRQNNLQFKDLNELQLLMRNIEIQNNMPFRIHKTILKEDPRVSGPMQYRLHLLKNKLRDYNNTYSQNKKEQFEVFKIPKKSGGFREIKAPNEEIKFKYKLIKELLEDTLKILPHNNAWAYMPKRSTIDAIQRHKENDSQWFLKVDIKKFFDNCSKELIETQLNKLFPLHHNPLAIKELAEFATLENELPQGTPLSPYLTNLIMVPFDYYFSNYCENNNLIYTRYADDIIISSKEEFQFQSVLSKLQEILVENKYPFLINKEKTRYGNRNGRNWNLGLMLNKDNEITLGHQFKRKLKVILHKLANEELEKDNPHLIGLFSYLKQIEPRYYENLNGYAVFKHGKVIKDLLKSV